MISLFLFFIYSFTDFSMESWLEPGLEHRYISYQHHHQFCLQVPFQDTLEQDLYPEVDLFDQSPLPHPLHPQNQQVLLEDVLSLHLLLHFL